MDNNEFELAIDEVNALVSFQTRSLGGAKAGLAELKRRKKLVSLQRRERTAQLREERSLYSGTREMSRSIGGGWISELFQSWNRWSAYSKTAQTDFQIAKIDKILVAIDRAILDLEGQIVQLKRT